MKTIEPGMYVRTENGIVKIMGFHVYNENEIAVTKNKKLNNILITPVIGPSDIIGEPSFDIFDVLKEGDYVNGHQIKAVYLDGVTKYIKLDNAYENGEGIRTYSEDIKTILTKEQYEMMCYEVERDETN